MDPLTDGTFDADAPRRRRIPPFAQSFQEASEGLEAAPSNIPPTINEQPRRIPEWSSEAYKASLAASAAPSLGTATASSTAGLSTLSNEGANIPNENVQLASQIFPAGKKSLSRISLRALCIGVVFGWATAVIPVLLFRSSKTSLQNIVAVPWTIPFFVAALALFHFLEFWTTATYNTKAAKVSSFLLSTKDRAYNLAHTVAISEALVRWRFFPGSVSASWRIPVIAVGLAMVISGQTVRSLAMKHAGVSFNHQVQWQKSESHVLVTSGVFAYFRHPSYFGFFWWAIGTQLVTGNWFSLIAYIVVLWKFFNARIKREEQYLMAFFGMDYKRYRERTAVYIPFIK